MKIPGFYFHWLQKDNPTGEVEQYPELTDGFETTVPGIYCIGGLTGIPLIKLAAENGFAAIDALHKDPAFQEERKRQDGHEMLDLVIAGAGPAGYIKRQTWTLILIQWFPLFLIPVVVLPVLGGNGWLPLWIMTHVFPDESYWRAFGFVLAWPLFLWNVATGSPYLFWLVVSLVQTFVIIPYIVYRWGKRASSGQDRWPDCREKKVSFQIIS